MVALARGGMPEGYGAANSAVGSHPQIMFICLDAYRATMVINFKGSVSEASCVSMCITFHGCLFNISSYS